MKISNFLILILIVLLVSCTKETDPIDEPQIYEKKVYNGNWRYTNYYLKMNVGIIKIDTTYPGTLELNISQDSIKSDNDFFKIAKSMLLTDSLAPMRPDGYCRCNGMIELSPDEKNVRYVLERYPQNAIGTMKYLFIGEKL